MEAGDGEDLLQALVLEFVPEAIIVSSVGKERNYRLPFASASNFGNMFREMDARVRQLCRTLGRTRRSSCVFFHML